MKHIHYILYGLLIMAGLSSCQADNILEDPTGGGSDEGKALVMLNLSIPASQLPAATRTIPNDSEITSLHLLVFEEEKLDTVMDITSKYQTAQDGKFYVTLKETDKPVEMSIVANTNVNALTTGTDKTDVVQSLTFDNSQSLSTMPMYGEATEKFTDGLSKDQSYDVTVKLVRALAKIEVIYDSSQTKEEFDFLGIEVLNTHKKGYIASGQGTLTDNEIIKNIIVTPPTGSDGKPTASAYVAETDNNESNKISVLIHGKYYGDEGYYRLDMIKDEEENEIASLVRNYRYIFVLNNVNYKGRSRADALTGDPDNKPFEAVVMTISADESAILDITTDDQFFLGVNSSTLQLKKNIGGLCYAKLKILTNNYKEGWEIKDVPDGVRFNPGTTGGKNDAANPDANRKVESLWVFVDLDKVTEDFNFYILSGKIRKTITVKLPPLSGSEL